MIQFYECHNVQFYEQNLDADNNSFCSVDIY